MKCRKNIRGQKIWIDDNNSRLTRPPTVEIVLLRDGETYRTITLDSSSGGSFIFPCLIIWRNATEKYIYTIDETATPAGYSKTIQGYNITNTLDSITISGTKIWNDNFNNEGYRPTEITVRLLQNDVETASIQVPSPLDTEDRSEIPFGEMPFADAQGVPYVYTITEDPIDNYDTTVNGYIVTNTLSVPDIPFSFTKKSKRTGMALQDASFEITKNGIVQATALSDINGTVSFIMHGEGAFGLHETQPPVGYMDNPIVYDVMVTRDGTVTVDGKPASEFSVENESAFSIERATAAVTSYKESPNTWPLHGTGTTDLYMTDKIKINLQGVPVSVKWDYGIKDVAYFSAGGGFNITGSYADGIQTSANGDYTVYALLGNGLETAIPITIDRIRDGSAAMPYLLIDYATAVSLEPSVSGIGKFTLNYMQGNGVKLSQNYEIYENIDMTGITWEPIGIVSDENPSEIVEGFTGSLYGNNNSITNFTIGDETDTENSYALFRAITDGASIQNLKMENFTVSGGATAAAFVALANITGTGTVTLKDLYFSGTIKSGYFAGGVIAIVDNEGTLNIDNISCSNTSSIITESYGGGIIGQCSNRSTAVKVNITNCIMAAEVQTNGNTGGIIGWLALTLGEINIANNINLARQRGSIVGGILGASEAIAGDLRISSCCSLGEILSADQGGGIVGMNSGSQDVFIIENCYNAAATNKGDGMCGSIAGMLASGTIDKCYNICSVTSEQTESYNNEVGGLVGMYAEVKNSVSAAKTLQGIGLVARISADSPDMLSNNMALENMEVLINSVPKFPLDEGADKADGLSITAAQIKTQGLYQANLGWNFTNVWSFGNGGYTLPVLRSIPLNLQPNVLPAHLQ